MTKEPHSRLSPEEREARRRRAEAGAERRRLIEHTRIEDLTPEDIEARKKAHAEHKAEERRKKAQSKRNQKNKRSGDAGVKSGLMRDSEHSSAKPSAEPAGKKPPKPPKKSERRKKQKYRRVEPPKASEETVSEETKADLDMNDFRKARKKLKMKKRLKRLIIVLILVIIAAAVYYTRSLWLPKLEGILDKHHDTIVNDDSLAAGNFPLDVSNSRVSQITRLDGSPVAVDEGHILTYSTNGRLRDTAFHSYGNPVVRSAGKRLLCYDYGGSCFKLIGKTGESFEKRTEGTVLFGQLAENGSSLIVTEDNRLSVSAKIYDKNGSEIYSWRNGDRIIDACFSPDSKSCTFVTFGVSEGVMYSQLSRCDLTKSNTVTVSDKLEGLVIRAYENSEGNIWAVTNDRLCLLSDICRVIGTYDLATEPSAVGFSESSACIVLSGAAGESESVNIFAADDVTLTPHTPTDSFGRVVKVRDFDGMIFVLCDNRLNAYAPDGALLSTVSLDGGYTDFVYADDAVYLLSRREINKIKFKT